MSSLPSLSPRWLRFDLRTFSTDTERRFYLLIFAILSTSLYIFHAELVSLPLSSQYASCISTFLSNSSTNTSTISGLPYQCSWQVDSLLILSSLVGELAILALAFLIYWFLPAWKCRREQLAPMQESELAGVITSIEKLRQEYIPAARLHYVLNPSSSADPYVFGHIGKYYLSLSGSFVLLFFINQETFQKFHARTLHEISHLYNKDVNKTYFTITIWYAFVIIALLPYLAFLLLILYLDPHGGANFALSGVLSVLAMTTLVYLIRASVLRSREVYADMHAAHWADSPEILIQALNLSTTKPAPEKRFSWHSIFRAFKNHPDAYTRQINIQQPQRVFHLKFGEALVIGITLGIALPSIHDTFSIISQLLSAWILRVTYPTEYLDPGTLFLCLFAVLFIIGPMIWRAMLVARIQQQELHGTGRLGLCLAAGLTLGFSLSLYFTPLATFYEVNIQTIFFYVVPWILLLALGLASFCKWLALLASLWLEVVNTQRFFRFVSRINFVVAGLILTVGLAIFSYYLLATLGYLLQGNLRLSILTHPISLQNSSNIYLYILIIFSFFVHDLNTLYLFLTLAGLAVFPLLSWFWYRRRLPMRKFQWALADFTWLQAPTPPQSPFRLYTVVPIALVGSLIFCTLLLAIHQGLLYFVGVPTLTPYGVALFYVQIGFAALFQAAIAAIIFIQTRPLGTANAFFGAFLSGCMIAIGTFDIYSLLGGTLGGSIAPVFFWTILFYNVNWGTLCTLGTLMMLKGIMRSKPRDQLQSREMSQAKPRDQHRWYLLLIFIPCIILIIGAIILPQLLVVNASEQSQIVAYNTSIVKNGDFEEPIVSPNAFVEYNAGHSFQGWAVASGSVDLIGSYWLSAHGNQSLDLDGSNAGTIYQDLPTSSGTSYTLSFYLAGNPVCAPPVKQMQVWWGSTLVATLSFDITGHSTITMGWQKHSYKVQATSSIIRLRFVSMTQSACGVALDAISVTP